MKNNKRTIAIMLITIMLMTSLTAYADKTIGENALDILKNQLEVIKLQAQNMQSFVAIVKDLIPIMLEKFKDVKETDWYKDNLALLFGMDVVEGNEKGDFMPNKKLTGSEYLKMVVVALDGKKNKPVNGIWDKPYINRALELGLVKKGEIADYSEPLNRYNMARIIVRACKEEYGDYNQYQNNIKDYDNIPREFKEYVLKTYSKGLINGYTDGTFKGDKTMRRSEATAVIARLIDPSQRVTPQKPKEEKPVVKLDNPVMQMVYDNISDLVVPEARREDIIFYAENGKANFNNTDLFVDMDYDTIFLNIEKNSPKTLSKAKEIIKLFYPNSYEKVYKAVLDAFEKDIILHKTVMDGRTIYLFANDSRSFVSVRIGREVK